ncbi:MAG: hypothetical protein QNJ98_05715 [Planctomycetota bacterium]|nr:hypothetical protein [Planctomycetota bacterium]
MKLVPALVLSLAVISILISYAARDDDSGGAPADTEPTSGAESAPEPEAPKEAADPLVRTPRELLAQLHRRLTTGEGLQDRTWQDDIRRVAEALWPADERGQVPAAGRVHVQLAGIAASTAPYVLRDDDEGRRYLADNPEDRVAHDAFLAAIVTGPEGYRTWVESTGGDVLATWQRDRRARILGK